MKQFQLDKPYKFIYQREIINEISKTTDLLERSVIDTGTEVNAHIYFEGQTDPLQISLWNSDTTPTYQTIGNWTDEQVNNRILEMLQLS
jgi:hypothetical protein